MITEPGIYELPAEQYHADPCPTPSLSAGMINDILIAPAKCFHNSRRLNPDYEEQDDAGNFSIGSVSHIIHLEPAEFSARVVVLEFADWRKNEAKDARMAAKDAGKIAILKHQMDEVKAARAAFVANRFTANAYANGRTEASLFWRHPRYGIWCRARPDFLADGMTHMCDHKATANADPRQFGRHAYNMGYHRRAAWYLEGIGALAGVRPDHYWFVNQEPKAPYLASVVELDWQAIDAGQDENDAAAALFAKCLETGEWPGYRDRDHPDTDRAFRVGLPTYALMQIDERLGRTRDAWPAQRVQEPEYEGVE